MSFFGSKIRDFSASVVLNRTIPPELIESTIQSGGWCSQDVSPSAAFSASWLGHQCLYSIKKPSLHAEVLFVLGRVEKEMTTTQ